MSLRLWCISAFIVGNTAAKFTQWSCDDIVPGLCDFHVETGSLSIRNVNVKYWRYKRHEPFINDDPKREIHLPIVALHGGPGWPHDYLLPLKQLACRGAEVIFYDQAGCGKSALDENTSLPKHLLDAKYYSEEELPSLIEHWGLDRYHVFGHSWGTILAQLFALNAKNTSGLQSLTLAGPLSDSKAYIDAQWDKEDGNLGSLPPFVQDRIKSLEKDGAYGSAEYQAIDQVLTTFFTLRTAPPPDCFTDAANGANAAIYVGMQGPSEFTVRGTLEKFNVTGRLHEIDVPVLLTHGQYDTMRPSIVKTMEEEIKMSERKVLPHSGHVSMIDDAELMNDYVADFLRRVETNSFVSQGVVEEEVNNNKVIDKKSKDEGNGVSSLSLYIKLIVAFSLGLFVGKFTTTSQDRSYTMIE